MKASRAGIKTTKAVKTVGERLSAVEERLAAMQRQLTRIEKVLTLVVAASADKPSTAAEALGKPGASKVRTTRKRGGA